MSIPFTQYLRPDGRKRSVEIDMDKNIEDKAQLLIARGLHFDIEELSTGTISMTCENSEDIISMKLCSNGPEVIDSVKKLVEEASVQLGI
jgi:phosphosulfolactate synthase (CoM biosynthesis protein A)